MEEGGKGCYMKVMEGEEKQTCICIEKDTCGTTRSMTEPHHSNSDENIS